jgi:hypothetical protein
LTSDFIPVLDAMPDAKNSTNKEALETISKHIQSSFLVLAAGVFEVDVDMKALKTLAKNMAAVEARLESDPSDADPVVVNGLAQRLADVALAYNLFKDSKTKANTVAFNKAMVVWRQYKLPLDRKPTFHIELLKQCLLGIWNALEAHNELQKLKVDEAYKELAMHVAEARQIALGTRDGGSWKDDIDESWDADKVVEWAHTPKTGLINGPGAKVVGIKEVLTQAFQQQDTSSISNQICQHVSLWSHIGI